MSDPNILYVCPECSEKLYQNKGKFTMEQLLKADMVKSAFSAGKRVEHMWVKVSEVQVENQLVKGTLDNTPTEITHLTFGEIVFVPFKDIEDIWIEGQVPKSVKQLLEIKKEELKAEEFVRSLFERVETMSARYKASDFVLKMQSRSNRKKGKRHLSNVHDISGNLAYISS